MSTVFDYSGDDDNIKCMGVQLIWCMLAAFIALCNELENEIELHAGPMQNRLIYRLTNNWSERRAWLDTGQANGAWDSLVNESSFEV